MTTRNFVLGILFCLLFSLSGATVFGKSAKLSRLIQKANSLTQENPELAKSSFEKAFRESLELTRPENSSAVRERGFALAAQCLHPSLFPEVEVAIETYLNLYPKGRYRRQVLLSKALLAYALGDRILGEKTLVEVEEISRGSSRRVAQYLHFHGLIAAGKFRSADEHLRKINEESPRRLTRGDRRRFTTWEKTLDTLVADVKAGKKGGMSAIRELERAVGAGYVAPRAPEAALLALAMQDAQNPAFHAWETTWCGKTRIGWHHLNAVLRMRRLEEFLRRFPEAPAEMRARALQNLQGIYVSELGRPEAGETVRRQLAAVPGFARVAQLEKNLENLTLENFLTTEGREILVEILAQNDLLPYDNGWLPVITTQELTEMLALSSVVLNDFTGLARILANDTSLGEGDFNGISHRVLYQIAADARFGAYQNQKLRFSSLNAKDQVLFKYLVNPMYLPTTNGDRQLIAALLMFKKYPTQAIERLLHCLTTQEKPRRLEYPIALLAEIYQEHKNYMEAQQVWTTLAELYPKSLWIH